MDKATFLGSDLRTVYLEHGDERVRIVIDAQKANLRWLGGVQSWDPEKNVSQLAEMLAHVIVEWDVEDFPPVAENLEQLAPARAARLSEVIMQAIVPSSEEGNASSASSSASVPAEAPSRPDSPSSPNGSASTDSPIVSASPSGK